MCNHETVSSDKTEHDVKSTCPSKWLQDCLACCTSALLAVDLQNLECFIYKAAAAAAALMRIHLRAHLRVGFICENK